MVFGQRLKDLRENSIYKQTEVADMIGVKVRTLQNYERGDSEPNLETLVKIADVFNVSTDYLLGRSETPLSEFAHIAGILHDMHKSTDAFQKQLKNITEKLEDLA